MLDPNDRSIVADKPTPAAVALKQFKKTQSKARAGTTFHERDKLYSKEQYLIDKETKDKTLAIDAVSHRVEATHYTDRDFDRLGQMLVDYSMDPNNITFSGFFRGLGLPPTVLFENFRNNPALRGRYELARVNLAYNNEKMLERKLNPQMAAKVAQFQAQFDPVRQRDRRQEKRFEEKNKLTVLKELVKERKEYAKDPEEGKTSYEIIYDGKKVEI